MVTYNQPLTVEQWNEHREKTGEHLHVYLDGQDVTLRCRLADPIRGVVELYRLNARRMKFFEGGKIATMFLIGRVEIKAGEPFPVKRVAA
jgi:hypothetical protein